MDDIVRQNVPALIKIAKTQVGLDAVPKPFQREIYLCKAVVTQQFNSGTAPEDLAIPLGSPLEIRRPTEHGTYRYDYVIAENSDYSFSGMIHDRAVKALLDAGFEMFGKLSRVSLQRVVIQDLHVLYFRHVEIEISMRN